MFTLASLLLREISYSILAKMCSDNWTYSSLSQGVRISWLHWFKKRWSSHYRDWTTEEAVNVLFRPRTLISRKIFCEELSLDGDMQHFVGPANRFVCHSWKSSFSGLIDGLLDAVHENEAVLWIDMFSMQLHQQSGPPKSQIFYFDDVKNVLSRMASFSLYLEPLFHPATFESRWCLFEAIIFIEGHPSSTIDAVLSPEEYVQLLSRLHIVSHATSIEKVFARIELSTSDGAHHIRAPTDVIVPHGNTNTRFRLHEIVFNKLRNWLIQTMKVHFDKSVRIGDDFYINLMMTAINNFFQDTGDNVSFFSFVTKFFNYKQARFGDDHIETLIQKFESAKMMHKLQRYSEAITLYHQCLDVKRVTSGCQDTTVLSVKNELAVTLLKFLSFDAAYVLFECCVINRRLLLGNDHLDTLDSEFHFSSVLGVKNQFNAALSLIKSCLKKRITLLGSDHPITLQTLSCKAQLELKCMSHSKLAAAKLGCNEIDIGDLFSMCLAKQEKILGKLHDDTIMTRNNFALACSAFGNFRQARILFAECLDGIESCFGPNHPTKIFTMRCSASVAMASGEAHIAEQLYKDCLSACRALFGKLHPMTLMTIEDLGHINVSMERFADALSLFQECHDGWTSLGQHSKSLSIAMYRAATFRIQGDLTTAHSVVYESLLQSHRLLGPTHSTTLGLEVELGDVLYAAARWSEAKVLFKKVTEQQLTSNGDENLSVVRLMPKLASVYEQLGKYTKSRNLRTYVHNCFDEALGSYHPDTIDCMFKLAQCMYLCHDLDGCENMTISCLDRCRSLKYENMGDQRILKSMLDAVRRRRVQVLAFERESGDDLMLAMNLSLSMK